MSLPLVYIYPFDSLVSTYKGFEECTDVEACFLENLRKFPQAKRVEEADVAFFPLTLGSKLHPHAGENVQYLWRRKYSKLIADVSVRRKVPHFLLCAYVLYKVNLSFIPGDCRVLSFETEVTFGPDHSGDMGCGKRMITIPYILSQQSHPSAGVLGPRPGRGVMDWGHFVARTRICYIGNAVRQGRDSSLVLDACSQRFGSDFVKLTPLDGGNVFATYAECKVAIVLRGDTPTRKAFYHAISYGAVPVVFRSTLLCYGELFAGRLPVQDLCLTIPDLPIGETERAGYLAKVISVIEGFLGDIDAQRKKQAAISTFAPDLDYMCQTSGPVPVSRPVLRAVEAVIGRGPRVWVPESPIVFYHNIPSEFNKGVFPVRISERETVHDHSLASQYSLEIHWDRSIRHRYLITTCFDRASFAFVPLYSFLVGWKDGVFSNAEIASKMNRLLNYMHEWHTRVEVPHVIVYSDVLWDNVSSFLHAVTFPPNTRLITLESTRIGPEVFVSPYVTEWNTQEVQSRPPNTGARRSTILGYVGKASRVGGFKHPRFSAHLIEQKGWRSINDAQLTLVCRNMFTSSRYSWQPHGDRRTRRSFFQSLFLGCIPVVSKTCLHAYRECLEDLVECVVVVDDDMQLSDILEHVLAIPGETLLKLQENAKRVSPKLQIETWMDATILSIIDNNVEHF